MTAGTSVFQFWLIIAAAKTEGVKILRSTLDPNDYSGEKCGAALRPASASYLTGNLNALSICLRFNLRLLGSNNIETLERGRTVHIGDNERTLLKMYTWHPISFFNFGYPSKKGHFASYLLEDSVAGGLGYDVYRPDIWNHFCFTFNATSSVVRMALNGRFLTTNYSDDNLNQLTIPSELASKVYLGRQPTMCEQCCQAGAKIAHYQMWDRELTASEALEWTSCKKQTSLSGNFVSWDTATWDLRYMEWATEDIKDICTPPGEQDVLFPDARNFSEAVSYCQKMRGQIRVIDSNETAMELLGVVDKFKENHQDIDVVNVFTGWNDEDTEGRFVDPNTGRELNLTDPSVYAPFRASEPNGKETENCVIVDLPTRKWLDGTCKNPLHSFCHFPSNPRFKIRGLYENSIYDKYYALSTDSVRGGQYSLVGYTNTLIYNDGAGNMTDMWYLDLRTDRVNWAETRSTGFPLGLRTWNFISPALGGNYDLNLYACDDRTEYNCDDGFCTSIENRCDGNNDCPDGSDEVRCDKIILGPSYLKEFPSVEKKRDSPNARVNIELSVDLLNIMNIDERESLIRFQYKTMLRWRDLRLTYKNLKHEFYLNSVSLEDVGKIWYPTIVFYSTIEKHQSKFNGRSLMFVNRTEGDQFYHLSPDWNLHNDHLFRGSDHDLVFAETSTHEHVCHFDLTYYPFDRPQCEIIFTLSGNSGKFSELVAGSLEYLGPSDLLQYYVQSVRFLDDYTIPAMEKEGITGVQVQVELGRRLLSQMLATYLPTAALCIVSFATNFFKPSYFEATVTVNLTTMLVLTSLFISISDSQPRTAYIKLMDIWLIFCLLIPFAEVLLHALLDTYRKEDFPPPSSGIEKKLQLGTAVRLLSNEGDSQNDRTLRFLERVGKYGFPAIFVCFAVIYFAVGLVHSIL